MILTNQSFEIINQTDYSIEGILKHIERCARVSYKSEQNITEDSYRKFTNMLITRGHYRPLEFGTVCLIFNDRDKAKKYERNHWSKVKQVIFQAPNTPNIYATDKYYVTTNYRVIIENGWLKDLEYLSDLTVHHYKRYTVHMILSRGVMDEFRTHVGLSHLAESTRYCNYSKGKFGGEVTFIKPNWFKEDITDGPSYNYKKACEDSERWYFRLLERGCKPQEAREVLSLGIKSELISCGFKDAWDNFFMRRDASDAHPMAQEIAHILHKELYNEK